MFARIANLFSIKTKFEAFLLIYALGLGAVERGHSYLVQYPGPFGWTLFAACTGAVFLAGSKILDGLAYAKLHR